MTRAVPSCLVRRRDATACPTSSRHYCAAALTVFAQLQRSVEMFEQRAGPRLLDATEQLREKKGHAAPRTTEVVLDMGVIALTGEDDQVFDSIV